MKKLVVSCVYMYNNLNILWYRLVLWVGLELESLQHYHFRLAEPEGVFKIDGIQITKIGLHDLRKKDINYSTGNRCVVCITIVCMIYRTQCYSVELSGIT